MRIILYLFLLCVSGFAKFAIADIFYDNQQRQLLRGELLTHHQDNNHNEYIALALTLQKNWQTYGNRKNSGGLPPKIDYSGSSNLKNAEIFFPPDQKFSFQDVIHYGYKNNVVFPIQLHRIDNTKPLLLNIHATILVCKIICVPAQLSFTDTIAPLNNQHHHVQVAAAIQKLSPSPPLVWYLLLALLGGLLLNILPCVLPALSLKFHALQTKKTATIKKSLFATALGLFGFFILLGVMVYGLHHLGYKFFWGSYFQSPFFISLLLLFFIFIFLSSLKNFAIASQFSIIPPIWRSRLATLSIDNHRHGLLKDFILGFIMAILSASCLAPLVSISLAFAFYQTNPIAIPLLLGLIGLGLALPWLLLPFFPMLYQWRLPKKYRPVVLYLLHGITSIALLVIILWLVWLLKNHIGWLAGILPILCFASITTPRSILSKNNFVFLISNILIWGMFLNPPATKKHQMIWQNFTTQPLHQTHSQPTLLVITADWCITCQVNKKILFDSKSFAIWVKENNIRLLLADWTKPNQKIANFIINEKRVGIPLTIFYNQQGKKKILPELLSLKNFYNIVDNQ
ncbi:MAG: thioredoxin family protein [Alphaproteobacteria bacterium]